jgi:serine/threonine protein kinase
LALKILNTAREMLGCCISSLLRMRRGLRQAPEERGSPSRIYSLYQRALDLPRQEREKFLQSLRRDNEAEYKEIRSLLEADSSSSDGILGASSSIIPTREPPPPRLKPGDLLGRYEILELIAVGGMGEVYKASHPELGVRALKILSSELSENAEFIELLRLEAKAANALNHPNIVTIHDFDRQGHLSYIVMEFVEGQLLRKIIKNLSVDDAVKDAMQMAEALNFAHSKGIIHRDIKPDNIMVRPDGKIKILDFGLAKPIKLSSEPLDAFTGRPGPASVNSDPDRLLGTLRYMSPEQLDRQPASPQSDIWSWGVVFYEMLAGRHPFDASTAYEIVQAIRNREPGQPSRHRYLNRIVLKALRKKPEDRYRSMANAIPELTKFRLPSKLHKAVAGFILLCFFSASYLLYRASLNPRLSVPNTPIINLPASGARQVHTAISPDRKYVAYTTESGGTSTLNLVPFVDGQLKDNPQEIANSRQSVFSGIVFAKDSTVLYFLCQNRINGIGVLYGYPLHPGNTRSQNVCNATSAPGGSSAAPVDNPWPGDGLCNSSDTAAGVFYRYRHFAGRAGFVCVDPGNDWNAESAESSVDSAPSFSPDGAHFLYFHVNSKDNRTTWIVGTTRPGEENTLISNLPPPYYYLTPLWSPDGKKILVATWGSLPGTTIEMWSFENGKLGERINRWQYRGLGLRGKPAWLNGGQSIVVAGKVKDASNAQLLQIRLNGEEPEGLRSSPPSDFGDVDSITCPQGWLSSRCRQELIAITVTDACQVAIAPSSGDKGPTAANLMCLGITWKDPRSVVLVSADGKRQDLISVDIHTKNRANVIDDDYKKKNPVVSPDGHYLVYSSNGDGGSHLWRKDLRDSNSKPVPLTAGNYVEDEPSISPDSHWVIYTSTKNGKYDLWKIPLEGNGQPIQVTGHDARKASFSPDGEFIVCEYLERFQDSERWVIRILDKDGAPAQLQPPGIATQVGVRWYRPQDTGRQKISDQSVLYVGRQGRGEEIWSQKIGGGNPVRLTHLEAERIFAFALSPDGKTLAALAGQERTSSVTLLQLAK